MSSNNLPAPADRALAVVLSQLDRAVALLEGARTVDEIVYVHDLARAAAEMARAARLGLEAQNHAAEIKLRAERKAGQLLAGLERAPGARTDLAPPTPTADSTSSNDGQGFTPTPSQYAAVLEETGLTRQTANRWQRIAELPAAHFDGFIEDTKGAGAELTTAGVLRFEREVARADMVARMRQAPPLPDGPFRVLYGDFPWAYDDEGVIDGDEQYGRAERYYPPMSIAEMCEMGERNRAMATDDAVLFMWVTSPFLEQCFAVIRAWGFRYKSSLVWDKVRHNYAHYNSMRHEFLLVCVRGNCTPDVPKLYDSVVTAERTSHSAKPEVFREIIDSLYVWGDRIELFARGPAAPGWVAWGNQVEADGEERNKPGG